MAGRFFSLRTLRTRVILLSAAPSIICVFALLVSVHWLMHELHGDIGERLVQSSGVRLEAEVSETRARVESLSRMLGRDAALGEALAAGAPGLEGDLLPRLLAELRRSEPMIRSLEATVVSPAGATRSWRASERCLLADGSNCARPELSAATAEAAFDLPGGTRATLRLAAFLDDTLAERLVGREGGGMLLLVGRDVLAASLTGTEDALGAAAPGWALAALAGGRAAAGPIEAGGRHWTGGLVPLAGIGEGGSARLSALLLVPHNLAEEQVDRSLALIAQAVGVLLAILTLVAIVSARRIGGVLAGLTEALRRLGRGDLNVSIPPPPPGASSEMIDLIEACSAFRDTAAERSRLSERLRWLANFDGLTGLPNRALMGDRLELAFASARRDGNGLVVLAMDLDRFKEVNDTLGHAAGDEVLRVVAGRLRGCLRVTDTLARVGGDEFVLVAPGLDGDSGLSTLAARLLASMEEPVPLGMESRSVGLSIGAAVLPAQGFKDRPEALLQDADLALYQAKADGGGCLRVFEPGMDEKLRTRRALTADLRQAVERQELTILFQPQVSTATRRIKGAEALLRWYHPSRGLISPDTFIPLAEESGLIVPIGAWVLEEACQVARGWKGLNLAVNVSPIQVRQVGFVATVERALARSGLPPERLELEITEAAMLANTADTLAVLSRLRSLGVRLAMDDFGTGYSSLATLQRFRFDKIKVDRSFIRHLENDPKAIALLRAVIAMGSALDVITNAEGVEEEGQLSMLRAEGCEEAQGYLFGRPMSAAEFQVQAGLQEVQAAFGPQAA